MRLKIPPAIVLLFFGLAMYLLAKYLPVGHFDFYGRLLFAKILFVVMGLILIASIYKFIRAKTTIDPLKVEKATALVSSGIYKYTRNPMYLAMLLLLIALGLKLANAFNMLLVTSFVSYINAYQIKPEESMLTAKFGKEYRAYCRKVRRWF